MAIKPEDVKTRLEKTLSSLGYDVQSYDSSGKSGVVPQESDAFQINFSGDDNDPVPITFTIDGTNKLIVYGDVNKLSKFAGPDILLSWEQLLQAINKFTFSTSLSKEIGKDNEFIYIHI